MDDHYIGEVKAEIERWESQGPGFLAQVGDFILLPAQKAAELLIPEGAQEAVGKAIQEFISGLGSATKVIIDEDEVHRKVKNFLHKYDHGLRASDEAAKQYWSWHIAYAAAEGAATGAAGLVGLAADIPALFTISLRLIMQVGICYGYDVTRDEEHEYVIHVLRTGSTGDIKAKMEFLVGLKQIEQILVKVTWSTYSL
jgi:hypothetical protein